MHITLTYGFRVISISQFLCIQHFKGCTMHTKKSMIIADK